MSAATAGFFRLCNRLAALFFDFVPSWCTGKSFGFKGFLSGDMATSLRNVVSGTRTFGKAQRFKKSLRGCCR